MGLRLMIGRAGVGKTTRCMQEIVQKQKLQQDRLILLVPEQYTSQAERDIIGFTEGRGILTAEVLSFGRLAHYILQKQGVGQKKPLGDTGKAMALRKILIDEGESLLFFKKAVDKQGFVEQLGHTLTELCQYCISSEMLIAQSENGENPPAVREKFHDLGLIYNAYNDFIRERYFSGDSLLDLLTERLSTATQMENTEIWIDGFYGFTPQEYRAIGQLLRLCRQVTVTLTMDEKSFFIQSMPMSAPFFEPHVSKMKLIALANQSGVAVEKPVILTENRRNHRNGILFLEANFLSHFGKTSKEYDGIQILRAGNRDLEIRRTAMEIISQVRDGNLRYRDIAVVTNGMGEYEKSLCGILEEYNIPYFIDRKKEITAHPFVSLVLSLMDIFVYHLQYEGIFGYLKTGLGPLTRSQTDRLENYVLAAGIKGYGWFSENRWKVGILRNQEEDIFGILESRDMALAPLIDFYNEFERRKAYPAKQITRGLLKILEILDVEKTLEQWTEDCRQSGQEGRAREHAQIFKIVMELFEKLVEILGNENMTLSGYQKVLQAGIANSRLGIIPPTTDSLLVGDLERTRLPEVSTLFVLGVNEGILPSVGEPSGVWTDRERELLEQRGIALSGDGKRNAFLEQYVLYLSFSKPRTSLVLSYCAGDLEGKLMRPSSIISRLHHMFPTIIEMEQQGIDGISAICTPAACMHKMGEQMYRGAEGAKMEDIWRDVYSFFYESSSYQGRLLTLRSGLLADSKKERLSNTVLKKMFKRDIYSSVSQLERFASCPFSYFAEFGLKAKQRQMYELRLPDLGLLFHTALECFSKLLTEKGRDWFSLTKGETETYIELAVDEAAPKLGNEILFDTAANRYLVKRLKRISKRAAWTLTEHIQMGNFKPVGFELGFGQGEALPPVVIGLADGHRLILRGKIDRIDIMDGENNQYVKVIDYKSNSKEFNFQDIYYGLQLQLLVYLNAYLKNARETEELLPGGIFYFQIKDKAVAITNDMSAEEIYTMLFRDMRMSGLVLAEPEVIHGLDHTFELDEKGRLSKGNSAIIPVAINADGSFRKGTATVADAVRYEKLMAFAMFRAKEAGEAICRGEIAPYPTRRNGISPCGYCKYGSICGFAQDDPEGYRRLLDMEEESFWTAVENAADGEKE